MDDTTARDVEAVTHHVFQGLVPELAAPVPERAHRAMRTTVPILLVGSVAAMTLNLTGAVEPASAKPPVKPRGATAQLGMTIKQAVAAASSAVRSTASAVVSTASSAPPTYIVTAGDTVSDIATRYGLSTASVLALNGLSWSSLIFPGQELKLTNGSALPAPDRSASPSPSGRYTIVAGDTISAIADRFGVSTLSVLTANGLGWSSIIYPGQTLAIPGLIGPGTSAPDAAVEPAPPVVDTPVEPVPDPAPAPAPAPLEPPALTPALSQYTVVAGDTLSGIAARHGVDTQALLDANGLAWDSLIFTGDVILIPGGGSPASVSGSITYLDDEMRANAAVIVQVGRELGVPDYGIVIALATAMQESSMRNLDWGDRDSVGLFQQRPSSGWGSVEQLTTPSHAARLFYGGPSNPNAGYTRGLLDIAGWESMPLTVAAQAVQISAFPDAYAKWEESARAWLAELG